MKQTLKIFFILMLVSLSIQAQDDLPSPMSPPRLVNDFAETFSSYQQEELEQMLLAYNDSTSTQIYVVTVTDLKGYDVSDFAVRLGEKWGIGQKDKNNGVLILIKPRIGNERGRVFIATGYGVEHILTDARCGRIIDDYMMSYLQEGDYYNAAKAASVVIMQYLAGEFQADGDDGYSNILDIIFKIAFFIFLVFLVFIIIYIIYIFILLDNECSGGNTSGGNSGGGSSSNRNDESSSSDRNGGSSSGGRNGGSSSSGGGFRGGGGGSFGGGGGGRSF